MHRKIDRAVAVAAAGFVSSTAWAGIYSGPTDTANAIDGAIPAASAAFVEWADGIDASRTAFAPRGSTSIDTSGGFNSLGDLDEADINAGVAPGFLTVTFPNGVANGPGADFAVFENGFVFPSDPNLFAELAYVEVSTNGTDFARFPSISTNTTFAGTFGQSFGGFDTTNIFNLAGKHASGFGTPFDLDDVSDDPAVLSGAVDLANIQFIKLVDIPGNGAFLDSEGNGILDAWLTTGSGGFDFRLGDGQNDAPAGVGVINAVPEPGAGMLALAGGALVLRRRRRAQRGYATPRVAIGVTALGLAGATSAQNNFTLDFESFAPVNPDYPTNTGFGTQGVSFSGAPFAGWVAADGTDTTTPGFLNQYSAFPGSGADGSEVFAVAFGGSSVIDLPAGITPVSTQWTATTYTALSILQGDSFAKQFGGPTGDDPDLFTVTLTGYDQPGGAAGGGAVTGTPVTLTLADYTFVDNSLDFVVDTWQTADLTPLGDARSIGLSFFSTDVGTFGINTPTYLAIDSLTLVPEPGVAALGLATLGLAGRRRRHH